MNKSEILINYWKENNIINNKKLFKVFRKVNRENFVLDRYKSSAYEDRALPILENQTISQPTTVIIMLDHLDLKKSQKVLDVGCGSGYLAALISKIVESDTKVYSTEIYENLVSFAKENLEKENIDNVKIILSNDLGYKRQAPYDRIVVSAAATKIPLKLIDQLKVNGIMIIPIGSTFHQRLYKITKEKEGLKKEDLGSFSFVRLK